MRIVVTDTCFVWKRYRHILEKFKDMLLVVFLEGKPETDEYKCLVCSQHIEDNVNLYSYSDVRMDLFPTLANGLNEILKDDEEIVFLTDYDLISLYPFISLSEGYKDRKLHLCTIFPFKFDMRQYNEYQRIIGELPKATSVLSIDSNKYLASISCENSLLDILKEIENQYISMVIELVDSKNHKEIC